jgi:hypothetical protein
MCATTILKDTKCNLYGKNHPINGKFTPTEGSGYAPEGAGNTPENEFSILFEPKFSELRNFQNKK